MRPFSWSARRRTSAGTSPSTGTAHAAHHRTYDDGARSNGEDSLVRESQRASTQAVIDTVAQLPGRAAVVSGWVLPRLMLALGGDRLGLHRFIYLIEDDDEYRRYLTNGWQIYYLPGVDLYESQAHHLELADLGARELAVPRERQRPASSGE